MSSAAVSSAPRPSPGLCCDGEGRVVLSYPSTRLTSTPASLRDPWAGRLCIIRPATCSVVRQDAAVGLGSVSHLQCCAGRRGRRSGFGQPFAVLCGKTRPSVWVRSAICSVVREDAAVGLGSVSHLQCCAGRRGRRSGFGQPFAVLCGETRPSVWVRSAICSVVREDAAVSLGSVSHLQRCAGRRRPVVWVRSAICSVVREDAAVGLGSVSHLRCCAGRRGRRSGFGQPFAVLCGKTRPSVWVRSAICSVVREDAAVRQGPPTTTPRPSAQSVRPTTPAASTTASRAAGGSHSLCC